jgi:mono/diheme cytochrome c family protein
MIRFLPNLVLCCLFAGLVLASDTPKTATPEQVAFYETEIRPILTSHCLKCHGAEEKIKGGLNLTNRAEILKGGDTGPAFDEKKPKESILLKAIHFKDEHLQMPPKGKLADAEIAKLEKWVTAGLAMPADKKPAASGHAKGGVVTEEAKKYWAYQPVKKPAVPAGSAANPIDRFLNVALQAKGLTPNPQADKVALVRRLYYDLTGLPPTPEQVDEFVKDTSPKAYEQLVDRLLASPHYGEKWGRHWLDLVRYAESNGYERDGPKPNAWRFRDYVIKSFNEDKPYDRFLKEQIAGDELWPSDTDAIIATGFYRLGTWDDEPADPKLALFDGYDDLVATAGQAFLATTFNCARCHDHKVDPIPAADYYRMVAFFRDVRPFSETRSVTSKFNSTDITPLERRKVYEAKLKERDAEVEKLKATMKPIEDAAIKKMPPKDQLAVDDGKRDEIVRKVPQFLEGEAKTKYQEMRRKLNELTRMPLPPRDIALSVNHCDVKPATTFVMIRGNPNTPGKDEIKPGFPAVLGLPTPEIPEPAPGAKSSGRRTVLANWLASPSNPFTARVFVNRVWQHHFGKGIVATPNDFGKLGEKPSHPELLDWLAATFVEGGWKLKPLHKRILMSDAYKRSSAGNEAALKVDPTNTLLWRFSMRRLNAEEVRDSMLAVSGSLDLKQFGPSVYPKIPDEILAGQSVPGDNWLASRGGGYDPKNPDAGNRRTIYVCVKRSLQVPVMANHDQADTDSSCPVRYTTTVPTQALGMMNGEFANERATAFAERLTKEFGDDLPKKIAKAIRLTTGRVPSEKEIANDLAFLNDLQTKHGLSPAKALQQYCLLALNANEFVYVD